MTVMALQSMTADLRPFAQAYKGSGRQERLYYVTIKTASCKKHGLVEAHTE